MNQFKSLKFEVSNEVQAVVLQEALFKLGYGWLPTSISGGQIPFHTDACFFYAESDGTISCDRASSRDYFNSQHHKLVSDVDGIIANPDSFKLAGQQLYLLQIDNGEQWADHSRYTAGVFSTYKLADEAGAILVEEDKECYPDAYIVITEIELDKVIE